MFAGAVEFVVALVVVPVVVFFVADKTGALAGGLRIPSPAAVAPALLGVVAVVAVFGVVAGVVVGGVVDVTDGGDVVVADSGGVVELLVVDGAT